MKFLRSLLGTFVRIILGLLALIFLLSLIMRIVRRFYQFPIPAFIVPFIDNPLRRRIQPPEQIVGWMNLEKGMMLLEIGPGPGTFTFEAARRVGEHGRVYTIDIQESVISGLKQDVSDRELKNVIVELASAYELPYPDSYFDRIYLVTVLGEIPDKQRALAEFRRVLKDEGYLAIGEFLPDPDYPRRSTVSRWCGEAGFELADTHGNILHYLLLFKKA
jgi:ubiquinone/menaquinone biosynthesis C-methylase UbiE